MEEGQYRLKVELVRLTPREGHNYPAAETIGEFTLLVNDIPIDRFKRMVAIANGEEA